MRTTAQMRQNFHQLTTPSGPKRHREDNQGWPSYPKEGDKWARREAPKRQLTQESPGDNDGRHTPSKLTKVPTEDTDTGDNPDTEHHKEEEDTK